jgi:signal transduction histidine kinase
VLDIVVPPCIALAAFLTLFFAYSDSLFVLNHQYYAGLDFLKKSSATEKRSILEKISAGLLHEIKNPITAIQSLNQQLLSNHSKMPDAKIEEYLNIILNELIRVKNLSESFLTTFRTSPNISKLEINIHEIIKSVCELLMFEIQKKGIKIALDDSILNKTVFFNNHQLRQVFLNLVYNSIEAGSKSIEIYSGENENQIEIYIKDDGNGINNQDQERLFSPFFTTKLDGTGMGLVISREIMHENSGNLMLVSSKKGETIFRIQFKKHVIGSWNDNIDY